MTRPGLLLACLFLTGVLPLATPIPPAVALPVAAALGGYAVGRAVSLWRWRRAGHLP